METWYELKQYRTSKCDGEPIDVFYFDTKEEAEAEKKFNQSFYKGEGYYFKIVECNGTKVF